VIVRCADSVRIVDYHCLTFLFIISILTKRIGSIFCTHMFMLRLYVEKKI